MSPTPLWQRQCKWLSRIACAAISFAALITPAIVSSQTTTTGDVAIVSNATGIAANVAVTNEHFQAPGYPIAASTPKSHRGFYLDISAILFGWLAVIFALATVGAFIWGVSSFSALISRVETDVRSRVDSAFSKRLTEIFDKEIRPKVQTINEEELDIALEKARTLIQAEMQKTIDDSDLKSALIDNVSGEIMKRLSREPPSREVKPEEFE